MDRARTILAYTLLATALHGAIALATSSHRAFFGPLGEERLTDDVRIYHGYASRMHAGAVPYRDFLVEYPPLALPVFALPRLVAASFARYRVAFAAEMLLFDAAALFLVARRVARTEGIARVPGRLAWYTAVFAGLCPIAINRFDLAPMALTFAAALAWFGGRPAAGGALTAGATLMKVYPGVLIVPALVWETARGRVGRGRGPVAFAAAMALGVAAWLAIGGDQAWRSLGYHAERGLELGSIYAGASIAAGKALDVAVTTDYNHASTELIAPWAPILARLALPIQAAALLAVGWQFRRSGTADPMRFAAAALLAFITFGKVLSPQYLIWAIPFVAILPGRDGNRVRGLYLLCCVTTTLVYPWSFDHITRLADWAVNLLNYRNVLLLGLWGLLTFGPVARPEVEPADRPSEIRAGRRPLRIGAAGRA